MTRIFLVGCPRSGTTLLQSILAAHPQIISFPESHYFTTVISSRFLFYHLGIASWRARSKFYQFLDDIGQQEMREHLSKFPLFTRQYARAFVDILDTITRQQRKSIWLEKTPRHLHYLDDISRLVSDVRFIHLIRNGVDVVASLYEVANTNPEEWKSLSPGRIEQCVQRWIKDILITRKYLHMPNHSVVRYETLVEKPRTVLTELCEFIGAPFSDDMLKNYQQASEKVVQKHETWKMAVKNQIQSTNNTKFYSLFDERQREYVSTRIAKINLDELIMK